MAQLLDRKQLRALWEWALAEDGATHDLTSLAAFDESARGTARIVARQAGIFAGQAVFDCLREVYGTRLAVDLGVTDGQPLDKGTVVATLTGSMQMLMSIERTLLNFLQRLCGVATLTRRYVDAVADTSARIYDTRKTIPGWRQLDKYAVRCGGGQNHRMGLNDAVLVKDNHLAGVPTARLAAATFELLDRLVALKPAPAFIEFEADSLEQVNELLKVGGIDVILLDNFTPAQMRQAVARRAALGLTGKIEFEASGGVDLASLREIAATGVERISVGTITHSAPALDLAMEVEPGLR